MIRLLNFLENGSGFPLETVGLARSSKGPEETRFGDRGQTRIRHRDLFPCVSFRDVGRAPCSGIRVAHGADHRDCWPLCIRDRSTLQWKEGTRWVLFLRPAMRCGCGHIFSAGWFDPVLQRMVWAAEVLAQVGLRPRDEIAKQRRITTLGLISSSGKVPLIDDG